jgi:hypothetical protein
MFTNTMTLERVEQMAGCMECGGKTDGFLEGIHSVCTACSDTVYYPISPIFLDMYYTCLTE